MDRARVALTTEAGGKGASDLQYKGVISELDGDQHYGVLPIVGAFIFEGLGFVQFGHVGYRVGL